MIEHKTGPEFIRAIVELFDDLYQQYKDGDIDHVTLLSVGGTYLVDNLVNINEEVQANIAKDARHTIGSILDAMVESSILERYTENDKVIYKPHKQFDEVLKHGKW